MSFTQPSQHLPTAGGEDPMQCFQRLGQPHSQRCYALVEEDEEGVQFVRWSSIQELYEREGKVRYVVDDNVLVPLVVGRDLQIVMPERILAYPSKTLYVALNDEQPGCLASKTPTDVHPISTTDDSSESGPSSSLSHQSEPWEAGPSSSSFSSSSVFMTADMKQYTAKSSSSSLALSSPVAVAPTAAVSSPTAVSSDEAGPSPFTWPAAAATDEVSFISLHTHLEVAQYDKNTVLLLPSTRPQELAQRKADHTLGALDRSPSRPSLLSPCCPRCRHRAHVDGPRENFIQAFASSTPVPVLSLHEPPVPFVCMDCSFSSQDAPIYPAAKIKIAVDDNSHNSIDGNLFVSVCVDNECPRSERGSVLKKGPSSSSFFLRLLFPIVELGLVHGRFRVSQARLYIPCHEWSRGPCQPTLVDCEPCCRGFRSVVGTPTYLKTIKPRAGTTFAPTEI